MSLAFVLLLVQAQQQTTPSAQNPPAPVVQATPYSYATLPTVAEAERIVLTPVLDGKIADEEWDPFSSSPDTKTYLQWEPGVVYAAATGPVGRDLVLSLDLNGDGWLVGHDNIEARVTLVAGKPVVSVRELDATNVTGPVWRDLPGFALASEVAALADASTVTYELKLVDPGVRFLPDKIAKLNARLDLVPTAEAGSAPFLPRALAPLKMVFIRAAALPPGLSWNVEHNERPVCPGDGAFMRFTFSAKPVVTIKKINIRSEGLARDVTAEMTEPFPKFDDKGRTFVDYLTKIDPSAELGYRVLRATLTTVDGTPAVLEAGYRIAPMLDFDFVQETLKASKKDRDVKIGYYLSSNTNLVINGTIKIVVPPGFKILNGPDEEKFSITDRRGRLRESFNLFVPSSASGTYPIVFETAYNGQKVSHTSYLTIQ